MFLTGPSIIRGITALARQATGRALHTSQLAMAPIKVIIWLDSYFKIT